MNFPSAESLRKKSVAARTAQLDPNNSHLAKFAQELKNRQDILEKQAAFVMVAATSAAENGLFGISLPAYKVLLAPLDIYEKGDFMQALLHAGTQITAMGNYAVSRKLPEDLQELVQHLQSQGFCIILDQKFNLIISWN